MLHLLDQPKKWSVAASGCARRRHKASTAKKRGEKGDWTYASCCRGYIKKTGEKYFVSQKRKKKGMLGPFRRGKRENERRKRKRREKFFYSGLNGEEKGGGRTHPVIYRFRAL